MAANRLAQPRRRSDQTPRPRPDLRKNRHHDLDLRRASGLAGGQLDPALDLETRRSQLVDHAGAPPVLAPLEQGLLPRGVDAVDRLPLSVDEHVHRREAQLGTSLERGLLEPGHRHLGVGPQHLPARVKLRGALDRDARQHAQPVLGVVVLLSQTQLDLVDHRLALLAGQGRLHLGLTGLDGGIVGQTPLRRLDALPVVRRRRAGTARRQARHQRDGRQSPQAKPRKALGRGSTFASRDRGAELHRHDRSAGARVRQSGTPYITTRGNSTLST